MARSRLVRAGVARSTTSGFGLRDAATLPVLAGIAFHALCECVRVGVWVEANGARLALHGAFGLSELAVWALEAFGIGDEAGAGAVAAEAAAAFAVVVGSLAGDSAPAAEGTRARASRHF